MGVATDGSGTPYVANSGDNVVGSVAGGNATTIVGTCATSGESGDGGPAGASLYNPTGLAHDSNGCLFVDDSGDQVVREVTVREVTPAGILSTAVNTTGKKGSSGDGGPATAAALNIPAAVAFDNSTGVLYIADTNNKRIREVTGGPVPAPTPEGGPTAPSGGPPPQTPEAPVAVAYVLPGPGTVFQALFDGKRSGPRAGL